MKTRLIGFQILFSLVVASGCKSISPSMKLSFTGRYQSLQSTVVTDEPLKIVTKRDGSTIVFWLIPPYHANTPVTATLTNSAVKWMLDTAGVLHADGPHPIIQTTKLKSVGIGTAMVVEVDGGALPVDTDDIHRVYFLGPVGDRVEIFLGSWTAGPPNAVIKTKDEFIEYLPDGTFTTPKAISSDPARAEFIKRVCADAGHAWPH